MATTTTRPAKRRTGPVPPVQERYADISLAELHEFLQAIRQRYGGDIPLCRAMRDAQGKVIQVPLVDIRLEEGLILYGPLQVAAGSSPPGQSAEPAGPRLEYTVSSGSYTASTAVVHESPDDVDIRVVMQSELPTYLQGTLYGSLDLSHLLMLLNTPSAREYAAIREVVDEWRTHGPTRRFFELFKALCVSVDHQPHPRLFVGIADGGDMLLEIPLVEPTGGALHRWFTSKDPWRLKRCIECGQYFFDASKNGRRKHCTTRCKSRHTSRDHRRRTAHADQPA